MDDDDFGLTDNGQDFKSLGYNSYNQGLEQEKGLSSLSEQEDVAGALNHFAAAFGATLALTHRRASTRFWGRSDIVAGELSQISSEEFCTQTARIAQEDERLLELDRAWFGDRFNRQGPLLGLERMQ